LRQDGQPAGLALRDHSLDDAGVDDRLGGQAVQQRLDVCFLQQGIGDDLEELRVERFAQGLGLGLRAAQSPGTLLELDADTLQVDRALVPVPGDAVDPDLGDDAPEAAVAIQQRGLRAGPC
jgi:hypothetical protein